MAVIEAVKRNQNLVRFKTMVLMSRLRVRLRMDELQKGETVQLQRSFQHLAGE